jgi:hypothetical protein
MSNETITPTLSDGTELYMYTFVKKEDEVYFLGAISDGNAEILDLFPPREIDKVNLEDLRSNYVSVDILNEPFLDELVETAAAPVLQYLEEHAPYKYSMLASALYEIARQAATEKQ